MTKTPNRFLILNQAGFGFASKDEARTNWRQHFENRSIKEGGVEAKLEVRNAKAADVAEVLIYDEIGYWGVTAKDFSKALSEITAPNITVRINSPGGDVFDGLAIYNALKAHPATVTAVVDGLAASAASFIALAADTVQGHEASMVMIHKAWGLAIGNADDAREFASTLDKIDGQLAGIYAAKTGKDKDAILADMAEDLWLTAEEAQAYGLLDTVIPAKAEDDNEAANNAAEDEIAGLAGSPRISAMRRRLRVADAEV